MLLSQSFHFVCNFLFLKGFLLTALALYTIHLSNMESAGPPSEGDVNQTTPIRIYIVILIFATILIVTLRFIVRKFITKVIGWDDWTILFALVGLLPPIYFSLTHVLI